MEFLQRCKLHTAWESLISDIPAGDGKITNLLFTVYSVLDTVWRFQGVRSGPGAGARGGQGVPRDQDHHHRTQQQELLKYLSLFWRLGAKSQLRHFSANSRLVHFNCDDQTIYGGTMICYSGYFFSRKFL
jgi:hypothetical protein